MHVNFYIQSKVAIKAFLSVHSKLLLFSLNEKQIPTDLLLIVIFLFKFVAVDNIQYISFNVLMFY